MLLFVATRRSVVPGSASTSGFQPRPKVQRIIDNLTSIEFSSVFANEYIGQLDESVSSLRRVSAALGSGGAALENPDANYGGLGDLKQVARLIAARGTRRAERDLFFLGYDGFDMHTSLNTQLASRFGMMDTGIAAFVAEMKAQDVWGSVVLATQSDFARTLDPNGNLGSDHAWAGQHMVLSGSIRGGRIYNDFPASLAPGSPADVGRGRLVPKYPYESYMVPIAKWLGVEDEQLGTVFPNFPNFNASHFISDLF